MTLLIYRDELTNAERVKVRQYFERVYDLNTEFSKTAKQ